MDGQRDRSSHCSGKINASGQYHLALGNQTQEQSLKQDRHLQPRAELYPSELAEQREMLPL